MTPTNGSGTARGIDSKLALLEGEGAAQHVGRPLNGSTHNGSRERAQPAARGDGSTTYYGRPVLKESVWGIDIPLYYFAGGAAGASLALGAAIQIACRDPRCTRELRRLSTTCHWIGIAGSSTGAALLIHDLGRPARFLHMMRVFRPTSPMNMGAWILAGAAPAAMAAGLFGKRSGFLGELGRGAGYVSGLFGAALAGYTGVLVSCTAIPLWQDARRWMPALFAASAMSSAAGIIDLFAEGREAQRIVFGFGAIGRTMELAAAHMVERSASRTPRVGEPLRVGLSGKLWRTAGVLTAAGLGLSLFPSRSRKMRVVSGMLAAAGSLALRFAVHYGSQASARDARASFERQRASSAQPV